MTRVLTKAIEANPDIWHIGIRDIRHIRRVNRYQTQPPMTPHTHGPSELDIIYLARGRQTQIIDGGSHTMTGGDLILVRPGDRHETGADPEEKGLIYWVSVVWPPSGDGFIGLTGVLAKALGDALAALIADRRVTLFKGHAGMQRNLDACLPNPGLNLLQAVRFQNHIVNFILDVVECAAAHGHPRTDWWVRKVKSFIEQGLGDRLDDNILAHHFGFSKPWFVSRFKREAGMPPMQFVQRSRIKLAERRLVEAPDRSITDIAFECGFATTEHFATVFKRYAGTTPSQFRALAQKHK